MNEKRINIWMDEETHRQVKILAALKGTTIQDYIVEAVKNCIEDDKVILERLLK